MSKKKGHRKRRRRKSRPVPGTPAALLGALADALNACDRAGMRVRFLHGIVYTDLGVLVPKKGKWVARVFVTGPDAPPPAVDDLDD